MANLPSLAELLKSQEKLESGCTSHSSLADLLAPSKEKSFGNNDKSLPKQQQQPSLTELLTFSSTKTSKKKNTPVSSDTPSLADLFKQNSDTVGSGGFQCSNQEISLNILLSPTNHQTKLPSLTDILKNSPDKATLTSSPQRIPDLSSLLKDVNISSSQTHNATTPLIESVQNIKLSDHASNHNISEGQSDLITHSASVVDLTKKDKFTKSYVYMDHSSNFGKILGAQYKRSRLGERMIEFDSCVMYTSGMLGTKTIAGDVYQFNDPSPDDIVKNIQNKAFERDGRK